MSTRGLYSKLLDLRESKNLAQFYWSTVHKTIGMVDTLSSDTVCIRQIDSLGEEDGFITIPTAHITHVIEASKEIQQIRQYLIQKSLSF
ncbi:MAG: hypothetical protein AB7V50_06445 [Vampirovibrionia bacterium]